jgi:phosphoribosylformimino-5-aminoimidazole carboxamide ribotide isomerase
MRIILALDIMGGKCVRLTRGNYETGKIYSENPLNIAREFENHCIRYLHFVDLDGAKNGRIINYRILEEISSKTKLNVDFGGGIRTENDLKIAFNSGAKQVTVGTLAVTDPSLFMQWLVTYGKDRIILGADFRDRKIVSGAWTESSEEDVVQFISAWSSKGVMYSICTDVERDGMMKGPSTDIYKEILGSAEINLIASGGISSIKDIKGIYTAGCEGVIVGKAVYEGKIKLNELSTLC